MISFDDLIMARARKGDNNAWKHIYQSCEKPMYSLALRMVGDKALAEDMVQDAFIKVMDKIEQYRSDSSFWWWVRTILVNHCISFLRKNNRWVHQEESEIESKIQELGEQPEIMHEKQLIKVLEKLPEQAQRVVYLYVVEGMTHKEIAELFGKTQSFSKTLLSRSLSQLRSWLNKNHI